MTGLTWRLFYWRKGEGKEEDQPLETGVAEEGEEEEGREGRKGASFEGM